jgi:hypothetical protein
MSWVKVNGLLYYKGLAWTGLLRLFHYPSCGGTRQSSLVIHRLHCNIPLRMFLFNSDISQIVLMTPIEYRKRYYATA